MRTSVHRSLGLALAATSLYASPPLALNEDSMMLFAIMLEQKVLHESISAYPVGNSLFVPLGEFCRSLSLGIEVLPNEGKAKGFVISEKRTFLLDLKKGEVQCDGRRFPLKKEHIAIQDNDFYVDIKTLETWFPILIQFDLRNTTINLETTEKLPLQLEWERMKLGFRNPGTNSKHEAKGLPVDVPYRALDWPIIDQSLSLQRSPGQEKDVEVQGATVLAGDFLWMSANGYLSFDSSGKIQNPRLTLFREDPDGQLLGPLRARTVNLGDIYPSALPLLGSPGAQRGVMVGNFPQNHQTSYEFRNFIGDLPPGWSVELLQNGAIWGYQRANAKGRYEFMNVPLRFGINNFLLVFHGPEGQRRTENFRLDLSNFQPAKGMLYYRSSFGRSEQDALQKKTGAFANSDEARDPLLRSEVQYGITDRLAATAAYARDHTQTGIRSYAMAGLQGALPFLTFQGVALRDLDNRSHAGQILLRSGYERINFQLRHEQHQFLFSQGLNQGLPENPLKSRSGLDLNALFTRGFQGSLGIRREGLHQGQTIDQLNLNLSLSRRHFIFGHGLSRNISKDSRRMMPDLEGALRASYEGEYHSLRGEFVYQKFNGHLKGLSGNAQWEWRPTEVSALQLSLTRMIHAKETSTTLSFFKLQGRVSYGLTLSHQPHQGLSASLNLHASFGRDPRSGKWAMQGASAASQGAVSAVAFLDENDNQKKEASEPYVDQAAFQANGTLRENLLSGSPINFITNMGRFSHAEVEINTASIEDPFLRPTLKSYRFLPRSGRIVTLDFPMAAYSEITGTVRMQKDGKPQELQGVDIVLKKADGTLAYQARSAYDGFFCFNDVRKGTYQLDLSDELKAKGLRCVEPRTVEILKSSEPIDGMDLLLEVKP